MNSETKSCQNCKQDFVIEAEDFNFYEQVKVPSPTWCPQCRMVRRFTWRNEKFLYKRKCGLCSKDMVSVYAPDSEYVVYCNPCWWGDGWDNGDYAMEIDWDKSFLEQFDELHKKTPLPALQSTYQNLVNSEYTNLVTNLKNCYLLFNSDYDENCSYGTEIEHSKECFDNMMMEECELSYGNVNCEKCFNVFFSQDLENCHDVWFSKNLSGCQNCFGCVNLRNKSYYIFNEEYSKEEYEKKIRELYTGSRSDIKDIEEMVKELFLAAPNKYMHEKQNDNVTGDYLKNSKDTTESFVSTGCRNCKYLLWMVVGPVQDCYDYMEYGDNAERVYEFALGGLGISDMKFSAYCFEECARVEYSTKCYTSSDMFGCVGGKKKQYCVLNKQYSKEEYEELIPKLKKHMEDMPYTDSKGRVYKYGEFFPPELSPWAYNETTAQEHAPLTEESAKEKGYTWRAGEDKGHSPDVVWRDIPKTIAQVDDDILQKTISCRAWDEDKDGALAHGCSQAFRITKNELEFYRRVNIPIPEYCFNSRQHFRLELRNPFKLWKRKCQCAGESSENGKYKNVSPGHSPHPDGGQCPNEFETAYDPEKADIVYCKECYQAEVI